MMNALAIYKTFIDGLVKRREGVLAQWVRTKGWPDPPGNREINKLLSKLTPEEKEVVAKIVQQAREGGIHDTLVFVNDRVNLNGLRISENSVEMAIEPYGTELYFDWVARCAGDPWPDDQLDEKYK
jgi:hypothetical protein